MSVDSKHSDTIVGDGKGEMIEAEVTTSLAEKELAINKAFQEMVDITHFCDDLHSHLSRLDEKESTKRLFRLVREIHAEHTKALRAWRKANTEHIRCMIEWLCHKFLIRVGREVDPMELLEFGVYMEVGSQIGLRDLESFKELEAGRLPELLSSLMLEMGAIRKIFA